MSYAFLLLNMVVAALFLSLDGLVMRVVIPYFTGAYPAQGVGLLALVAAAVVLVRKDNWSRPLGGLHSGAMSLAVTTIAGFTSALAVPGATL